MLIFYDSAQEVIHRWLSGQAGLDQYTDEENPSHVQNATDSTASCYLAIQNNIPRLGLTLHL